jgi:hypothetical protein
MVEEAETYAYETLLRLVTLLHVKQILSFSKQLLSLRRNENRQTYTCMSFLYIFLELSEKSFL